MKHPAVVIGMGEMGGSFARGLLRTGQPVVPILRATDLEGVAETVPEPTVTIVAVGEADLDLALERLPKRWHSTTVLLQNELLPRNWRTHGLENPTVAVVWFEKKPGRAEKVIIPTPVYGPRADILVAALGAIDIAAVALPNEERLLHELVRKNMYILTANIAGMVTKGTVHDLWYNHRGVAEAVAKDIVPIQEWLTGRTLDADKLIAGMVEAFDADPEHGSMGRSAPARLARALRHADAAGLETPALRAIAAGLDVPG
ncbi:MAG: hypothetical protein QNJ77_07240 [Acidimicrobiia bacterium]|nr:hypothetical protein [Acidimicrobiia bacterium]